MKKQELIETINELETFFTLILEQGSSEKKDVYAEEGLRVIDTAFRGGSDTAEEIDDGPKDVFDEMFGEE